MKGEEKKANWLETLGPEERCSGEFPGFPLYLLHPRLGAEETNNLETPMEADEKAAAKPTLTAQRTRKKANSPNKTFR